MTSPSNDDNVLQIYLNEDETLDLIQDNNYMNSESLFLKFFNKSTCKIEFFLSEIYKLLLENRVQIKGLYLKGMNSMLIEVLQTDSFKNWLAMLIEARNNIRVLSDKVRNNILNNAFGKFNMVLKSELIHMNVIPNVKGHTVDCRSSFYPYGLCNGNFINILSRSVRDNPEAVIKNIVNEMMNGENLKKVFGIRAEFSSGTDISVRFILKINDVTDKLLKSLNSIFGSLSFCSSTIHFIPDTQLDKFEAAMRNSLHAKEFLSILSGMDVLTCDLSEQALSMKRKNLPSIEPRTSYAAQSNVAVTKSSIASNNRSIFNRLGPRIVHYRGGSPSQIDRSDVASHKNKFVHDNKGSISPKPPKLKSLIFDPNQSTNIKKKRR